MAYLSPDAILTHAQKAPLTFELAVPQLAPLNNGTPIENSTRLELPLWLAEMLAVSRPAGQSSSALATLDMPSALGPRVINALRAGPRSVQLRSQAQWYYGLAERMLELFEEEEMGQVLSDTFKDRALEIADKAQNTRTAQHGDGGSDFMSGLDETERQRKYTSMPAADSDVSNSIAVFRVAHDGSNAVKKWFEVTSRA